MNIYDDYAKKDIDIKNLRIRIKDLEEEIKKLKEENGFLRGELSKVVGENLKLKEKLEKWEKDYKEGIIVHCRNG